MWSSLVIGAMQLLGPVERASGGLPVPYINFKPVLLLLAPWHTSVWLLVGGISGYWVFFGVVLCLLACFLLPLSPTFCSLSFQLSLVSYVSCHICIILSASKMLKFLVNWYLPLYSHCSCEFIPLKVLYCHCSWILEKSRDKCVLFDRFTKREIIYHRK